MGKSYFEFLEEEFQALTNQLQLSLAAPPSPSSTAGIQAQFTRCQAVLQQLKREARTDLEFQDRLYLYEHQLYVLQDFFQHIGKDTSPNEEGDRQEITFQAWPSETEATHSMLEKERKKSIEDHR